MKILIITALIAWLVGRILQEIDKLQPSDVIYFYPQKRDNHVPASAQRDVGTPVLEHIFLYGPAGTGKTTFLECLHTEMEAKYGHEIGFHMRIASQLGSPRDVAELLAQVKHGDLVVIDEIHSLRLRVEELLYSVLQDFLYFPKNDEVEFSGGEFLRVSRGEANAVKLPRFTICGATTNAGGVTRPLLERFPLLFRLERMTEENLQKVVSGLNGVKTTKSFASYFGQDRVKRALQFHLDGLGKEAKTFSVEALQILAQVALGTPRLANDYRLHAQRYAGAHGRKLVTGEDVWESLALIEVDRHGMGHPERTIIGALIDRGNKALGLKAMASIADVSEQTVADMVLPKMFAAGFLTKDHRNMNVLTNRALDLYN